MPQEHSDRELSLFNFSSMYACRLKKYEGCSMIYVNKLAFL